MKKKAYFTLSILLAASLFMSCGGKKSETTTKETSHVETTTNTASEEATPESTSDNGEIVFRIANGAEPESLDPALIQGTPEHNLNLALFEGLVGTDPKTGNAAPGLAKSWESNADKTQWTFHLRQENWSDGTPITANDVVYSWLRELNPETAAPYAWFPDMFIKGATDYNNGITTDPATVGIRALDDSTFQMDLIGPIPYAINALNHYSFGIVPQHVIEKWGEAWTAPEHFVGNGPFVLSERVPQSYISCTPNPEYWDKDNVQLDKVIFFSNDDNNTNYNMFINGEVDWDMTIPTDRISQASMRDDYNKNAQLGTYYFDLNTRKAPFDNPLVRKAFSLAIDRQELVDGVTKGGQIPAYGMAPTMDGYDALDPIYDNMDDSIAAAQNLLAEAGYPDGMGFPDVSILYNTSDNHKAIAEFVQQQLLDNLGINISLVNEEWSTFVTDRNAGQFTMSRDGWSGDYQDPNTFLDMYQTGATMNCAGYSNPAYDEALHNAAKMPASAERFDVLKAADTLISQTDSAVIPIYYYVVENMIDTNKWGGWYKNVMDSHPMKNIYLK